VGLLLVRIGLGLQFLTYALAKLADPSAIQRQVLDSHLLPPALAGLYGTLIPWWELAFGVGLLLGFATRFIGASAALALISYTIYISIASRYALFGFSPVGLDRNIALIFCALGLAVAGAGTFSVDRLLLRTRQPVPKTAVERATASS
jgi:uncharacterized membrane protein YphA (DoxX/SURF4 family)